MARAGALAAAVGAGPVAVVAVEGALRAAVEAAAAVAAAPLVSSRHLQQLDLAAAALGWEWGHIGLLGVAVVGVLRRQDRAAADDEAPRRAAAAPARRRQTGSRCCCCAHINSPDLPLRFPLTSRTKQPPLLPNNKVAAAAAR